MITLISLVALLSLVTFLFLQHPQFRQAESTGRFERIKQSKHYKDGAFANLSFTPNLTEGYSMTGVLYDFIFNKNPRKKPSKAIPHVQTDLKSLPADSNVVIWFGHSSYYMQVDGLKILVDPVFSGNASPLPGTTKAFEGTNTYGVKDLPEIDYLLISHDHYDHLDYKTIKELKGKVKHVICGLGVGAYFEQWGYNAEIISERDWNETIDLTNGIKIHTLTARHFSGRTFKRNNTLWLAYLLETPEQKIFIGGDGGYDKHFAEIGKRFGSIDLAILENGQYNVAWRAIHCLPEEVVQAAKDLNAKRVMPVHSGKFSLAQHSWDEPLNEVSRLSKEANIPLVTPTIGEVVWMEDEGQVFREWWKGVEN
ncbi:MBL fold metallo-hydrolase [Daejeonella lutea]|uniref:L-ascorbate metabolism protein UlaG, beta-lactamase superfamily n=1 Tax=Daejeonella lutea TaxID=572036 RepID=A0A1T5EHF5_9SPHI|nr:MBL fold metallo-hydrolase [Daejeonella lutea]SKB83249.1 L-ascorbate metabolism protein UlaG, beta-lactamase superfamily [Daejeonella lutea]